MSRIIVSSAICGMCLLAAAVLPAKADVARPDDNSKFALELYSKLANSAGNITFSPYSIEAAFALVQMGARGDTAAEIAKTLHLPPGGEDRFLLELDEQLSRIEKNGNITVTTANALWIAKTFKILEDFIELAKAKFHAEVRTADFQSAAEAARQQINSWVADKTRDKIQNLIGAGMLNATTSLVVVNAFYFKAAWEDTFEKEQTRTGDFSTAAGKSVPAPMMHQTKSFNYNETSDVQLLELPYKGDEASMIVLLPKKKDGLGAFEASLDAAGLKTLLDGLKTRRVAVILPRFKTRTSTSLSEVVRALGIEKAFVNKQADFSGIEASKTLFISDVIHQAFVETDEAGTEAAASTAILMKAGSAMPVDAPEAFNADHPFLYLLRENKTGGILLMGRVANPTE